MEALRIENENREKYKTTGKITETAGEEVRYQKFIFGIF
jgi:hypothetical protein